MTTTEVVPVQPGAQQPSPFVADSGLRVQIGRLAWVIESTASPTDPLGPAERAALRRLDLDAPRPSQWGALIRALMAADMDPTDWSRSRLRHWALIAQGMALSTHDAGAPLGQQLALAHVAESRVLRLLAAQGDAFEQYLPRLVRLMGSQGQPINWLDLGSLALAELSGSQDVADKLRLNLAGTYYAALAKPDPTLAAQPPLKNDR